MSLQKKSPIKLPPYLQPQSSSQGPVRYAKIPQQLMLDMIHERPVSVKRLDKDGTRMCTETVQRKLTTTGFQVFCALALYANNAEGKTGFYINNKLISPSREKLGAILGLDVRSIAAGIKNLEELGWIAIKKRRYDASSIYYLAMPNINLSEDGKTFRDCSITLKQATLFKAQGIRKREAKRLRGSEVVDDAPIPLIEAVKDVFAGFVSGVFTYSNEQLLPFKLSHKSTRRFLQELYPAEFDAVMNADLENFASDDHLDAEGLYLEDYEVEDKFDNKTEKF